MQSIKDYRSPIKALWLSIASTAIPSIVTIILTSSDQREAAMLTGSIALTLGPSVGLDLNLFDILAIGYRFTPSDLSYRLPNAYLISLSMRVPEIDI